MKRKSKGIYSVQMRNLKLRWVKYFFQGQMSYKNYNLFFLSFLTLKATVSFSHIVCCFSLGHEDHMCNKIQFCECYPTWFPECIVNI